MRKTLFLAMLGSLSVPAYVGASPSTSEDVDLLRQVMLLHGAGEKAALSRLAAEAEATDLYQRVLAADLKGYGGAWFDPATRNLEVALKGSESESYVRRLGAVPKRVEYSLVDLESIRDELLERLSDQDALAFVGIDPRNNRVEVGVRPGMSHVVFAASALDRNLEGWFAEGGPVRVSESELVGSLSSGVVRGANGTRNHTWALEDSEEHPCSIGVSVTDGYVTAGHCGYADHEIRTPSGSALGTVVASNYGNWGGWTKDSGYVETVAGWTPQALVNGYTSGTLSVPAKWGGMGLAPIGTTVCRYGQTSGAGTYNCGILDRLNQTIWFPTQNRYIEELGALTQSCTNDGDSGGPHIAAATLQVQGTNTGGYPTGTCATGFATEVWFTPIRPTLALASRVMLTAHGANSPTVGGLGCPDMQNSGLGTYRCKIDHWNSQGEATVSWSSTSGHYSSSTDLFGSCTSGQTVTVTLSVSNVYGTRNSTHPFSCPMGPIP